ncbi:MAG: penicillin-binding protein 2 [Deltaproteobacteria bacterium]|nr:penicillin-binding protein 2 [Deltaproteobacteria bacterium]
MSEYFKDKETSALKNRAVYVGIFVAVVFFTLAVRLWFLQIKEGEYYAELAKSNRIRTVKSPAPRGMIYDRVGVKLVDNRPGFDLYLVPEDVLDWVKTKEQINDILDVEPEAVQEKLDQAEDRPPFQAIKLKEDLSWEETVRIESSKFEMPGVILEVSPKRNYIFGEAFSHLIGYLGEINEKETKEFKNDKNYAPGDLIGKYGMEKSFEPDLKGVDGAKEIEVDALGRKIKLANWTPPYPGNDIKLTIDIKAQMAAWAAMDGKAGAVVAMEPQTGRILAIVSAPAFDPNALSSGISAEDWNDLIENPLNIFNNRPIQGLYPPASTFKPVHAAAALEEKVITPKTMIYSGPSFRFANRDYRDWQEKGHGIINVHRAIVESSDTFFYQVGLKLGVDRLAVYSKSFGFGRKTGIQLPNEKPGVVPSTAWKRAALKTRWYDGETISASVGQGYMLATPLQLASAYAAIASGGTIYAPQLVEEIRSPMGTLLKQFVPRQTGRLAISEETLGEVKDALEGVVNEDGGTARFLSYANLKIAGKTGTAQVTKLIKRERNVLKIPYEYRDHAWFAGYAPYDDPKIAVAVIVEHGGFGASSAAPVARDIFKAFLGADDKDAGQKPGLTPDRDILQTREPPTLPSPARGVEPLQGEEKWKESSETKKPPEKPEENGDGISD